MSMRSRSARNRSLLRPIFVFTCLAFTSIGLGQARADQACDTSSYPPAVVPATVGGEGLGPTVASATGAALAAALGAPDCAMSCADDTRCSGLVDVSGHVTVKSIVFIPGIGWYVKLSVTAGSTWTQTCDAC